MKAINLIPDLKMILAAHTRCLNYRFGSIADNTAKYSNLAFLDKKNLSEINFSHQNLFQAYMNNVKAKNACFNYANLAEIRGQGAIFSGSNMKKVNLNYANIPEAQFNNCQMSQANLQNAELREAHFEEAYLFGANFQNAYLTGANLRGADLRYANFAFATLTGADLTGADIEGANFIGANLQYAKLEDTNLDSACLLEAELRGAKIDNTFDGYYPLACPSEGEFIGWKAACGCLIELLIPADARRSSATSRKCRCDKAKVLSIVDAATGKEIHELEVHVWAPITYKVGEMVYPDRFDTNRFNECSNGIHFFINKQDAIKYGNLL